MIHVARNNASGTALPTSIGSYVTIGEAPWCIWHCFAVRKDIASQAARCAQVMAQPSMQQLWRMVLWWAWAPSCLTVPRCEKTQHLRLHVASTGHAIRNGVVSLVHPRTWRKRHYWLALYLSASRAALTAVSALRLSAG